MRKRLSSKMLAVILTLAICATTVLGCLMTASAAEASCYSFSACEFEADDLTEATIDATFVAPDNMPNGFVTGAFAFGEVNADAEDYLTFEGITSKTSGVELEISDEGNYVVFNCGDAVNSLTVTFTCGFSNGEASDKTYKIKLSEVELGYNDKEYFAQTADGPLGEIVAACKHVIGVVGEPAATNEANNYSVYAKSVCTLCGEQFGYQLVPTAEKLGGDDAASSGATIQWDGTKVAPTEGSGTEADSYIIS